MNLPAWFDRFMSPLADRAGELALELESRGVRASVLELAGGRYVVAWPKGAARDERYRVKVVTAHHDRVPGTPGALDNSAACLQLVDFLSSGASTFNTLAVFTDREELGESSPATRPVEQGSYPLGMAFAGMGLRAPMVFPLDVTGRGDAIVLSRAAEGLLARRNGLSGESLQGDGRDGDGLSALVAETDAMAGAVARAMAGRAPVFRATVPFGEDLGFICAGVPALTVTILPRAEAESLAAGDGLPAWASPSEPGDRMPGTWRFLHGPDDTPELYTDAAFSLAARFLGRLASMRVPAPVA